MTLTFSRSPARRPASRPDVPAVPPATVPAATVPTVTVPSHLRPEHWARATRWLVRKALAELSHERLLAPEPVGDGRYVVRTGDGTAYEFTARVLPLEHWLVDADSIVRTVDGQQRDLDALELFVELRDRLELGPNVLPLLLEEVSATLAAQAYRWSVPQPRSSELVGADLLTVEAAMREGHPCFVANSGRIGFDAAEYERYAPEAAPDVRLVWVAARRELATFASGAGMSEERLLAREFSADTLARFESVLVERGLGFADVHLLPVHPWQWDNRLTTTFAADLVRGDLVLLGHGDDVHRPQQSIRTFFNTSVPTRSYVKTALSVLNMGFLRGLSAAYMEVTPAINDHVAGIVRGDETLRRLGFDVLREHAAVGYRSPSYEVAAERGSPHLKMLAGLWRESPVSQLRDGETLATMASLLHVDESGRSFAAELVEASGLTAGEWLRRYLEAYLVPVTHCLVAHSLAFMPHGENVILVLRDGVVDRVLMKDIGEEVAIFGDGALPEAVERVRVRADAPTQALSVLTDVVDCFLRFLAAVLDEEGALDAEEFWGLAREVLQEYAESHPELAARWGELDLFAPEFDLCCLNRLQLRNNQQMLDLAEPTEGLVFAGPIANPLAEVPS
ncbi:siderophore synthetase component [Knoellia remsis]|uniref:Siderophore synthetase component n=1 Tax=Knoellia remsis TaxID=407159 RepID=A0A2T0TRF1_9MICO|nr:IucA/IucC family protein [Knoellia remsis]PRY48294.1 siderophore synthetase component [Knoellia remsis]